MNSLHDDVIKWKHFCVTGPLWGESTRHHYSPSWGKRHYSYLNYPILRYFLHLLKAHQGLMSYHLSAIRLVMTRSTGRSREAPSNTPSSTWVEELSSRLHNLLTNTTSFMSARAVSGSPSGSEVSIKPCHSSSLSASWRKNRFRPIKQTPQTSVMV